MYEHLICDGFDKRYDKWIFHGEGGSSKVDKGKANMHDNLDELLEDTFMMPECDFDDILDEDEEFDVEMVRIYNLVRDACQEAYPGCKKFSKLSIIVRLLYIKNLYGWSDVSSKCFSTAICSIRTCCGGLVTKINSGGWAFLQSFTPLNCDCMFLSFHWDSYMDSGTQDQ